MEKSLGQDFDYFLIFGTKNKNNGISKIIYMQETVEVSQLVARELASAVNTPKLLEEHAKVTNGFTRTRFPPEVRDICCFNFRPLLLFLYQF